MRILAVIPARGGSKTIPRKNLRLMNGKPLIYYAVNNAQNCTSITDCVVTSDSEEIRDIAILLGAEVLDRSSDLAKDATTLDPVVFDATVRMEQLKGEKYDIVITLQPTSPLLSIKTLNDALANFINSDVDTMISAYNDAHLAWGINETGYYPLYEKRLNRQMLPPQYVEAGAFFITKREYVTPVSRSGKKITVYEMPHQDAVDIDTAEDWITCESRLKHKKIVFRVDGYKEIGMGHIYRNLTLAYSLTGHDVTLVTNKNCGEGYEKLKQSFLDIVAIKNENEFFGYIETNTPDVVITDILDTTSAYMKKIKKYCKKLITFEDLGQGANYADAVINALYEGDQNRYNYYFGEKYFCLRDEFLMRKPIEIKENVNNVLVIFGGTDPSNLTKKVYRLARKYTQTHDIEFVFITGLSYNAEKHGIVAQKNIKVLADVKIVAAQMARADMAFTSQGRTVFELASMGVPSIVMAQNPREQLHQFAQMKNGFINLGLGKDVSDDTLEKTFEWVASTTGIRREMSQYMLSHNLKDGIENVKKIILE